MTYIKITAIHRQRESAYWYREAHKYRNLGEYYKAFEAQFYAAVYAKRARILMGVEE